jgi:hypothetical protein
MPGIGDKIGAALMAVFGVWMLFATSLRVKYAHVLSYRYVLSADGIMVSTPQRIHHVTWSQIVRAEYYPLLFFLRLDSNAGIPAIALFLDNKGPWDQSSEARNQFTRSVVKHQVGSRLLWKWVL